jgi:hypothetical protein
MDINISFIKNDCIVKYSGLLNSSFVLLYINFNGSYTDYDSNENPLDKIINAHKIFELHIIGNFEELSDDMLYIIFKRNLLYVRKIFINQTKFNLETLENILIPKYKNIFKCICPKLQQFTIQSCKFLHGHHCFIYGEQLHIIHKLLLFSELHTIKLNKLDTIISLHSFICDELPLKLNKILVIINLINTPIEAFGGIDFRLITLLEGHYILVSEEDVHNQKSMTSIARFYSKNLHIHIINSDDYQLATKTDNTD